MKRGGGPFGPPPLFSTSPMRKRSCHPERRAHSARSEGPAFHAPWLFREGDFDGQTVLSNNRIGENLFRLFQQLLSTDRIARREVREDELATLGRKRDLRRIPGSRVIRLLRAVFLVLAEGRLVDQ